MNKDNSNSNIGLVLPYYETQIKTESSYHEATFSINDKEISFKYENEGEKSIISSICNLITENLFGGTHMEKQNFLEKLGRGNYFVSSYYDSRDDKLYAAKIIKQGHDRSYDQFLQKSIEEIKMLIMLTKNNEATRKNLVKYNDFMITRRETKEQVFIVEEFIILMEICKGSLEFYYDFVKETIKFKLEQFEKEHLYSNFFYIFDYILNALIIMKNYKVIHFDLKPGNVLIQQTGNNIDIKISDLGEMISYYQFTEYNEIKGFTKGYAAPEVAQLKANTIKNYDNEQVYKVDIYSFYKIMIEYYDAIIGIFTKLDKEFEVLESFRIQLLLPMSELDYRKRIEIESLNLKYLEFKKKNLNPDLKFTMQPKFIIKTLEKLDHTICKRYTDIGFYSIPMYTYLKKIQESHDNSPDNPLYLGVIYSIFRNYDLAFFYFDKAESLLKSKEMLRKNECLEKILFINAHRLTKYHHKKDLISFNELLPKQLKNLENHNLDLQIFEIQQTYLELLYVLIENNYKEKALYLIQFLEEKTKHFRPNQEGFEYFFYKFYNLKFLYYDTFGNENDNEKLLVYINKSIELAENLHSKKSIVFSQLYNNLGCAHRKKKEFSRAIEYHEKAFKIREAIYKNDSSVVNYDSVIIPLQDKAITYELMYEFENALAVYYKIEDAMIKILKYKEDNKDLISNRGLIKKIEDKIKAMP